MRLVLLRLIAVALVCLTPLALWWGFKVQQRGQALPPEVARVLGEPVAKVEEKPLNLYARASSWTNQNGQAVKLADFKGHPLLVSFIYTSCLKECLLSIVDLKRIEKSLSPDQQAQVQVVLFSFDPERDSPAKLKEYSAQFDLDLSRWHFLTSSPEEVNQISREFNFHAFKQGNFYSHSVLIGVVNPQGDLVKKFYGNNPEYEKITSLVAPYLQAKDKP